MLMHLIPPHRLFSAKGVPATGFSGVISNFSAWSILSADQNFCNPALALVCVPRWQRPAFIRSNSSIWSSPGLGHCFSGDSQSILCGPYFVPFKCGVLATAWICWHCHRQILPTIITTPRPGAHSVWATVFGRLLSIVGGNIVPFKIREPAFAGFSAHAQHILIRCTYILSSGDRFRHRPNLFRVVLRDLEFLQSSFCAQVHCFLCLGSISAHARWILIGRSYFSVTIARTSDPFASISACFACA
jgi:hypothetical protein